jgi:hypothetical protein
MSSNSSSQTQSESEDNINQENVNKKTFLKDKQLKTSLDASRIKNEEKFELDHCTTGGSLVSQM